MTDSAPATGPVPAARPSPFWWTAAVVAVVLAASVAWSARQAVGAGGSGDFTTVYTASRAWAMGHDPYDAAGLVHEWLDAGGSPYPKERVPNEQHTPSVYPPGTFVVVAPLAATLRWPVARAVWAGMNLSLIAAMLAALVSLAGLRWAEWRAPTLVAAALALGPVRDGVIIGQPIIATTALLVLAVWAGARRRGLAWDVLAGVLLAVAISLKPPVAGPFALYYLLRRRWALGGVALVSSGLAMLVGCLRLAASGLPGMGLAYFLRNLHAAEAAGAVNDPTFHNPERFDMVNTHVLLHAFLNGRPMVSALVIGLSLALAGAFAIAVLRRGRPADVRPDDDVGQLPGRGLAEMGFVAAWALLPVYHRWHDAAPLVLVLAWAAVAVTSRRWTVAVAGAVALLLPFVVSLALQINKRRPHLTGRASPLLEGFLLPNQCWAALLLCGLLLAVLWRRPAGGAEFPVTDGSGPRSAR
jgi:hypothetical protein